MKTVMGMTDALKYILFHLNNLKIIKTKGTDCAVPRGMGGSTIKQLIYI